jgi:ferredoxin
MSNKVKFVTKSKKNNTILEVAKKNNIKIKAPCKKGKCGKCLVRAKGELNELTSSEKKSLSNKKIDEGYRLACVAEVKGDVEIEL